MMIPSLQRLPAFALVLGVVILVGAGGWSAAWAQERPADPLAGITLRIGVQDASAIGSPAERHGRSWAAAHQAQVRVERYPFAELYSRLLAGMTGAAAPFDVIFYAPAWAGDFAPYLAELPPEIAEDETLDDIAPIFRERLMQWNGRWLSVTVDGDLFSGYYRRDLFNDPAHRAAFAARYGYELAAPVTWRQYRDIAEFFTGRTDAHGRLLYGTAEAFARGGQQFWTAFARAAAYTNPPGQPGAQFFDPETMTPAVNNPGWARAIAEYVEILRFCPPDAAGYGIADSRRAFIGGHTAMTLDWGDTGPLAEQGESSAIVDQVGYFVLPGSSEVWDGRRGAWVTLPAVQRTPFLAFGGWVAAVPRNARQPQAAWNYILWFSSPANSLEDVLDGSSGINPYRYSHFAAIDAWTRVFSRRAAAEYLGVIRASLESPYAALDLRLPGFNDYTQSFEHYLTQVLSGRMALQPALDAVAGEWEAITSRRGKAAQRALYRTSMGLPPQLLPDAP